MIKKFSYPSPNFNERPDFVAAPDMIIIHHTNMTPVESALERLTDPDSKVSCHYLIHQNGTIYSMVEENKRAWHAGVSHWQDREGLNDYSIGIELDSMGDVFPEAQMQALVALIRDIRTRYEIPDSYILGHSDMAPDRKDDPSEEFNWEWLAEQGIGLMVETIPVKTLPSIEETQTMLKRIGYALQTTGVLDPQTTQVIKAFQRHFRRTKVDGVLDLETAKRIVALLSRY